MIDVDDLGLPVAKHPEEINCVCGEKLKSGHLLSCASCSNWFHAECLQRDGTKTPRNVSGAWICATCVENGVPTMFDQRQATVGGGRIDEYMRDQAATLIRPYGTPNGRESQKFLPLMGANVAGKNSGAGGASSSLRYEFPYPRIL